MTRPGTWFRPRRFGLGATPATWQGWLAVALFVGVSALLGNVASHGRPGFVILFVPLIAGFLWLCWAKTDGEWRWRWGGDA
ncbi:hypothetical protein ACG3SL_16180 [Sphingomonas sp. CJ20]